MNQARTFAMAVPLAALLFLVPQTVRADAALQGPPNPEAGPVANSAAIAAAIADPRRPAAQREQDADRQPATVLAFAGVRRGDVVVDLLAGRGYFTGMLARLVGPEGRVLAVNPPSFDNAATWPPLVRRHSNVSPAAIDFRTLAFAPASIDHFFLHLCYHDLYWENVRANYLRIDVEQTLAHFHAALRPGGVVTIVDHVGAAGDPREVAARSHRIDPARVQADFERAGFVLEASSDALRNTTDNPATSVYAPTVRGKTSRFMMRFRKL